MKDAPFTVAERLPKVLTVKDVCRVLNISLAQFYLLKRKGTFPIQELLPKVTRGPRFAGADVQRYLDGEFAEPRRRRA